MILVIEEELLQAARAVAAQRQTSVNNMDDYLPSG